MTKNEAVKTLNTAQYAQLIGRSERTARRWMAARAGSSFYKNVTKVNGKWQMTFTKSEFRALKRELVDHEAAASKALASIPLGQPADTERAAKERYRNALLVLGLGDIVLQIDHMRIWRGRRDAYGLATYRKAFADLERMVAA
jgi:hypothetical protein